MKKRKIKVTIGIFGGKLLMKYNVETKKNEKKNNDENKIEDST